MQYNSLEIEKQLTQRRLDVENLEKNIKNLQNSLASLKTEVTYLSSSTDSTKGSGDIDSYIVGGIVYHAMLHTFKLAVKFLSGIVTSVISPSTDSTAAVKITKADKTTNVIVVDTTNSRVGIAGSPVAGALEVTGGLFSMGTSASNPTAVNYIRMSFDGGTIGDILSFNSSTGFKGLQLRGSPLAVGVASGTIGFFGATAASIQTLNAYTTDPESGAYSGIATGVAGTPYAQLNDLNSLRVAYENLRASYDDLRTKLKNTTLVA